MPGLCNLFLGKRFRFLATLMFAAAFCVSPAIAQDAGPGPMAPETPQYDGPAGMPQTAPPAAPQPAPVQMPANSGPARQYPITNTAPSVPIDQIIQTFAAHEAEFKIERDNFTYTQDFDIQTIDDDGNPDGDYRMTSDITFTPDGKRYEEVTYAPPPTLERIILTEQDLDDVKNIQPFVLTTQDIPKYNITYVGRQRIDQLGTYVFDVAPKQIEKNQRYFQGRIWVEDKYLEIVKTDGKAVPDIIKGNNQNLFPRFETYRENIEGHYWFPTYTHSDDFLHFKTGDVHIRMTIRYTNYKRFRVTSRIVQGTTTPANK
ncbi:MAG TPA: hypothetical protein VMB47_13265 [Candidatus Aquilonibacter sp.]|nr:hypothetical protein [Candidatus Aquilonibacter sp.]